MPDDEKVYPVWCEEPDCGIDNCSDCPFSPFNLRLKQIELEKKVDDVKAMTKHSHPAFKLKGNQNFDEIREIKEEISSLRDKIKEFGLDNDYLKKGGLVEQMMEQIAELKEWKNKQEILDKAMRIEIHRNIPELIKATKKELGIPILEEVLRELSLCTYNLHQAIINNLSLEELTIGKSLFKLYEKLDAKDGDSKLKPICNLKKECHTCNDFRRNWCVYEEKSINDGEKPSKAWKKEYDKIKKEYEKGLKEGKWLEYPPKEKYLKGDKK